jgi:hypothetical protein
MGGYSTGGLISSRYFTAEILQSVLSALPTTQARTIRKLARAIDKRTNIGYWAALDTVAAMGVYLSEVPSSRISTEISTKSP